MLSSTLVTVDAGDVQVSCLNDRLHKRENVCFRTYVCTHAAGTVRKYMQSLVCLSGKHMENILYSACMCAMYACMRGC